MTMPNITQSEFIKQYCENSKMSEREINSEGLFAVPCDCDRDCPGWAMVSRETIRHHLKLYLRGDDK